MPIEINQGEALAYRVPDHGRGQWAFAGDYFHAYENGQVISRSSFSSGAIRFNKLDAKSLAVIRGTEVIPLIS